jgi:hypothetical protein
MTRGRRSARIVEGGSDRTVGAHLACARERDITHDTGKTERTRRITRRRTPPWRVVRRISRVKYAAVILAAVRDLRYLRVPQALPRHRALSRDVVSVREERDVGEVQALRREAVGERDLDDVEAKRARLIAQ